MQKMRVKIQMILGVFLVISAFTGGRNYGTDMSSLDSISLVSASPVQAATALPPAGMPAGTSPIIQCATCHYTVDTPVPAVTQVKAVGFIPLSDHTEQILQCAICHPQLPDRMTVYLP